MTTPEVRSTHAGAELPISPEELGRLASQIYAALPGHHVSAELPPSPREPVSQASRSATPSGTPVEPPGTGLVPGWLRDIRIPSAPGMSRGSVFTDPSWSGRAATAGDQDSWPIAPNFGSPGGRGHVAVPQVPLLPDYTIFDVTAIRRDFPVLSEKVRGQQLVWFDNAATTQKPRPVIERLSRFYERENSNIHRAAHELAARATDAYEEAREEVARFVGASRTEEVVFVRGTTEGINLVAQSWGGRHLGPGDEILVSALEHHANIVPWQIVAQRTGAVLKVAPVDDDGNFLLEEFTQLLSQRTKIVSVTQVANATGTVVPVAEVVAASHRVGARVLIDGAQSVPHLPVDLRTLDADFFVFSGHKIYGPTGIGALVIAERVWDETPPWQGGGNMIADVTHERSIYQGPPNKYEAGTGNIADAVGLGAALRYVSQVGLERIAAYEDSLVAYALPRLADVDGVRLVGDPVHRASVLSFLMDGHEPAEVGRVLNEHGIAVRAGHHCAQPALRRLGAEQTVRASLAFYNTLDEVDRFIGVITDLAHAPRS